jgi:histidine triad (HIT) family protein
MGDCLFCRIIAKDAAADVVYEDSGAVAFMDAHPTARGHVLVVPRLHAPTLLELDDAAIGDLFRAVKAVQTKVRGSLQPRGFNVGWNHGRAAGQFVSHLHVHIIPRYGLLGRGVQMLGDGADRKEIGKVAAAIRAG